MNIGSKKIRMYSKSSKDDAHIGSTKTHAKSNISIYFVGANNYSPLQHTKSFIFHIQ